MKSLYANNKHKVCGQKDGAIRVFALNGEWVRNLNYNGDCDLWSDVGGENILAAVTMVLPGGGRYCVEHL